ncbi:MAG: bifunctional DNA-formamidopyrimidine glycosylase/DNA-(apurinic or apyrimidinic site) lyase [Cardiobacteriaceae bacterium]|nr:bifunctional DNA-formamidopyrimidine glycosylase/DNA-(apurinic or apyrimidinic site) lyase [Cardiobacteriaceae bacterium]
MPELPEVETTRAGIAPYLENERIQSVNTYTDKLRQPLDLQKLKELCGRRILRIERRGKHLLLHTDEAKQVLHIHLGMSGSLRITDSHTPLKKHDHFIVTLKNGKQLRYHDPRRFGLIAILNSDDFPSSLTSLGLEPLSEAFSGNKLYLQTRGKTGAIKNHIMNQKYLVGVGNIYATEALFHSHIHPARCADSLSHAECEKLNRQIKNVLQAAIEQGGTTLRDFLHPDGTHGYFSQTLSIYGKAGQPCPICRETLQSERIGGRSSVFCLSCQPLACRKSNKVHKKMTK